MKRIALGREAATAVGAVVGALAGDRLANRDRWEQYEDLPREVTKWGVPRTGRKVKR